MYIFSHKYLPFDAILFDSSKQAANIHNQFPELWAGVNNLATLSDMSIVYFLRSASIKSPGNARLFWLGDQLVTYDGFDGLRTVLVGYISSGLSGISLQHSDIGGYTMINESGFVYLRTKQLLYRWMEVSAIADIIFRSHPGNLPSQSWQIYSDNSTLLCFSRMAQLHTIFSTYKSGLIFLKKIL